MKYQRISEYLFFGFAVAIVVWSIFSACWMSKPRTFFNRWLR